MFALLNRVRSVNIDPTASLARSTREISTKNINTHCASIDARYFEDAIFSRFICISAISKIAVASGVYRRNAYDAMSRLIDKGLAFEILSGGKNRYNAVDPGKLLEIAEERKQKIQTILPGLEKKFKQRLAPEEAYIYRGLEGQKNVWRDVLRISKESYFIGAKGGWYGPRLASSRKAFFAEANRKKIKFIQLFDYEIKEWKGSQPLTQPRLTRLA